jgi:preprotein translocase SecE subunit
MDGIMNSDVPPQVEHSKESIPLEVTPSKRNRFANLLLVAVQFFGSVKQEFWRISWTTVPELRRSTKVVLGGMLLAGFLIYGVDLVLRGAISLLNSLSFLIAG